MNERPILFNGEMVNAILEGQKTQTRRIVKPQPDGFIHWNPIIIGGYGGWCDEHGRPTPCPQGQPGNRLWVRENGWQPKEPTDRELRDGADTWPKYAYDADGVSEFEAEQYKAWNWKRRPSIHMPRWASRITLEITNVRVDRLQDISQSNAQAEGWNPLAEDGRNPAPYDPRSWYRMLWESINGKGSWNSNPWVWVIEFNRVEA